MSLLTFKISFSFRTSVVVALCLLHLALRPLAMPVTTDPRLHPLRMDQEEEVPRLTVPKTTLLLPTDTMMLLRLPTGCPCTAVLLDHPAGGTIGKVVAPIVGSPLLRRDAWDRTIGDEWTVSISIAQKSVSPRFVLVFSFLTSQL